MSEEKLNGRFIASVEQVGQLKLTGANNTPTLPIKFEILSEITPLGNSDFPTTQTPSVWKNYFITEKSIPYMKKELYSAFKYEAGLDKASLDTLVGKSCELVIRVNDKGYNEIQFVNRLGSGEGQAAVAPEVSVKLESLWNQIKRK